jgi:hypothetical protein
MCCPQRIFNHRSELRLTQSRLKQLNKASSILIPRETAQASKQQASNAVPMLSGPVIAYGFVAFEPLAILLSCKDEENLQSAAAVQTLTIEQSTRSATKTATDGDS